MQVLKGMVLLLAIGTLVQVILWKPEPAAPARPPAELQLGLAAMKDQVAEQESLIEQQRSQIKALTAQIKTSGASSAANEKQPDAEESVDADTEGARQQGASGPEPAPAVPAPAPASAPAPAEGADASDQSSTEKALDALIEHLGVLPPNTDPEFKRCGPDRKGQKCDCTGSNKYCGEGSGWCGDTPAHKGESSGKYDCPGRMLTKLDRLMAMPAHANLSKVELLKKVAVEDGEDSYQDLETAEEIVALAEQKKEEQRSKDIKNWHNMGKKLLGVVSVRCMLPSPCTHRTECSCTLYIHGTYAITRITRYHKNVRTYVHVRAC